MATERNTSYGKLTYTADTDTAKVKGILNLLEGSSNLEVINGVGFGALNNRLANVKTAVADPAAYIKKMEEAIETSQKAAVADYNDSVVALLDLGIAPDKAKELALNKVKNKVKYDLEVLELRYPSEVLNSSLQQIGIETAGKSKAGMLAAPALVLLRGPKS